MAVFQVEGRDALRILITERLAEVLQQADFVTLHFPRVQARQPCSSARELRLLRPGAYLVSCAGGSLIDEAALLAALEQGREQGQRSMSSARNPSETIASCGVSSPTSA